jgi:hypothetical protein
MTNLEGMVKISTHFDVEDGSYQGCTNSGCRVAVETKFFMVVPSHYGTCLMLPFSHLEF